MHIIDKKTETLKETSYDKEHSEYMVESLLPVCSFDNVKEWYVKEHVPQANPNPKSNDALYFGDTESFFIEFKNGKIDNAVNFELNKKIYDSLLILFDLEYCDKRGNLVDSIKYTRNNMNYILVYNEENYKKAGPTRQTEEGFCRQKERATQSPSRDALYKRVRELANEELIKFGLDQFKNYLFKNVFTYTTEEFKQKFLRIHECSM